MAISKHPFGRYQIIDRELRRKDWVKTKELVEIIQEELSVNVSPRQINNDINDMIDDPLLGYNAPIEKDTRNKAYRYTDRNYSIRAFGLKEGDINALNFYARTLNQYKDYEVFKDFSGAIEKVLDAATIRKGISSLDQARNVVQTQIHQRPAGSQYIPLIVEALNENRVLHFTYKRFDSSEAKQVKLEPHLLKEDHHLWYVIGKIDKGKTPTTTYALDRIIELTVGKEVFKPLEFDFEKHFKYSIGITVDTVDPIEIVMSFTPSQGQYLKALKIHPSEKILVDDDNEYRIALFVRPTWEFYSKILGYGDSVTVLSPDDIVETIRNRVAKMVKKYKN